MPNKNAAKNTTIFAYPKNCHHRILKQIFENEMRVKLTPLVAWWVSTPESLLIRTKKETTLHKSQSLLYHLPVYFIYHTISCILINHFMITSEVIKMCFEILFMKRYRY